MIARILPLLLLLILLPDWYIYRHDLCRRSRPGVLKTILWWLPGVAMIAFVIYLSTLRTFAPVNADITSIYLLLLGFLVLPKTVYALCSSIGLFYCRKTHSHKNYGNLLGFLLAIFVAYMTFYSYFVGSRKLAVCHEEFVSKDLPKSFDGYRIVHFSDLHVGSLPESLLQRVVDSINAQKADIIIFTGDLQNLQPDELDEAMPILSQLKAKDGVLSILGNHDYAFYLRADFATSALNEAKMKQKQHDMGWRLLLNENVSVTRGGERIVFAGMENEGKKEEQSRGDLPKTMSGVPDDAFVVMLQHDPTAWKRIILPETNAQLTLSGHTHGGQISLFGFSPVTFVYDEYAGMYQENKRALYVSAGLGGLAPFRFGVPPEFTVITLRR